MSQLGWPEIIFIVVIIVVLFGAKRLPDAARSLGRSLRIFKSEVKELSNDETPQQLNGGQPGVSYQHQPGANYQQPMQQDPGAQRPQQ